MFANNPYIYNLSVFLVVFHLRRLFFSCAAGMNIDSCESICINTLPLCFDSFMYSVMYDVILDLPS